MNSFDIVCRVNLQEVKNAVEQAMKEIHQRFDLKDSRSEILLEGPAPSSDSGALVVSSADDFKLKAVVEILLARLVRRGVDPKALTRGSIEAALGGTARQRITIQQGIPTEQAKAIVKAIKDAKFKVQAQIQGDQIRVQAKSRDALQEVIQFLRTQDFGLAVEFTNYR